MSERINLRAIQKEECCGFRVPTVVIDRRYPITLRGFMSEHEWYTVCDSIDNVLKDTTKYSRRNMCLNALTIFVMFVSIIVGGVIGYYVGPTIPGLGGNEEEKDGKAYLGVIFGGVIGFATFLAVVCFMSTCCGFFIQANKGLLDVCRRLILAVENVSKMNPDVSFTLMRDISDTDGSAIIIHDTDQIFDLDYVWIQAITDGMNVETTTRTNNPQQEATSQEWDTSHQGRYPLFELEKALNVISSRQDLDDNQKAKLKRKVVNDFVGEEDDTNANQYPPVQAVNM